MGQRARCYGLQCEATGSYSDDRRCCPNGVGSINMADTTNATYDGGIDVPHECLSGANISINRETSKQFPKFNIKQRDAGHKNLRPLCIELLQELTTQF